MVYIVYEWFVNSTVYIKKTRTKRKTLMNYNCQLFYICYIIILFERSSMIKNCSNLFQNHHNFNKSKANDILDGCTLMPNYKFAFMGLPTISCIFASRFIVFSCGELVMHL